MSWIRKMSLADREAAKLLSVEKTLDELRVMATERHRKDLRMGGCYIPLSVLVMVVSTVWLVWFGPPTPWRAGVAISLWLVPIVVTRIGLEGQRRGRIIALAFFMREHAEAAVAAHPSPAGD